MHLLKTQRKTHDRYINKSIYPYTSTSEHIQAHAAKIHATLMIFYAHSNVHRYRHEQNLKYTVEHG